jgi:hypothetical protein
MGVAWHPERSDACDARSQTIRNTDAAHEIGESRVGVQRFPELLGPEQRQQALSRRDVEASE